MSRFLYRLLRNPIQVRALYAPDTANREISTTIVLKQFIKQVSAAIKADPLVFLYPDTFSLLPDNNNRHS